MRSDQKIQPVLTLLNERRAKAMLLVAIDGHSAAGRSALARTSGERLPTVAIGVCQMECGNRLPLLESTARC